MAVGQGKLAAVALEGSGTLVLAATDRALGLDVAPGGDDVAAIAAIGVGVEAHLGHLYGDMRSTPKLGHSRLKTFHHLPSHA